MVRPTRETAMGVFPIAIIRGQSLQRTLFLKILKNGMDKTAIVMGYPPINLSSQIVRGRVETQLYLRSHGFYRR